MNSDLRPSSSGTYYRGRMQTLRTAANLPAFVDEWRRIGEAKNPGPYTYGGASSSSGSGGANCGMASATGPAMQSRATGSSSSATAKRNPPLEGAQRSLEQPVSRFDDPEASDWEGEELDMGWENSAASKVVPATEVDTAGDSDLSRLQRFEAEMQAYLPCSSATRPSATALWEECPAVLVGVVDLPQIEEDLEQQSFRTAEGWLVRDPVRAQELADGRARARRLGIQHMYGTSSKGERPNAACVPGELLAKSTHGRLARFRSEDMPTTPPLVELKEEDAVTEGTALGTAPVTASVSTAHCDGRHRPRRRKRGRRNRRGAGGAEDDVVTIWSFNGSGAPQLKAAVGLANELGRGGPIAILAQEHHACAMRAPDLQAQLKAKGWNIAMAHAVNTASGGRSAGVAVCTPLCVAAGIDPNTSVDCSPAGSEGRAAAVWVQQVAAGGILVMSCYLHDGEQGSGRNLDLLAEALQAAQLSGCPWLIGMDGQQPPEDLLRWAAPLLNKAGATIAAPAVATHFPGVGCSRCLDYFVISRELADAVAKVDTISELRYQSGGGYITVPAKPHRVVQITLK